MKKEIERKFTVTGDFRKGILRSYKIAQGYLSSVPERIVRIRIKEDKAFITIKGPCDPLGVIRDEWEKEISITDAEKLLNFCEPGILYKIRHEIRVGKHIFEVDEFLGRNEGLFIAEVELSEANESFEKPSWIGKEVTGDKRYYSAYITSHPYTEWQ